MNCLFCQNEFKARRGRAKNIFCSLLCYWNYKKEKRILPPSRLNVRHTKDVRKKISIKIRESAKRGSEHYLWKGDKVGIGALHRWVESNLGKPSTCQHCGGVRRCEWANKSGEYKRDLSDWVRLCRPCHHKYDDISAKVWKTRRTHA